MATETRSLILETPPRPRRLEREAAPQQVARTLRRELKRIFLRRIVELLAVHDGRSQAFGEAAYASFQDVQAIFENAVRFSVQPNLGTAEIRAIAAEKEWERWQKSLPPEGWCDGVGQAIVIGALLAPRPEEQFLSVRPARRFGHAASFMAREVAKRVERLLDSCLLGYILYRDGTAGGYSYVLRRVLIQEGSFHGTEHSTTLDESKPWGERHSYTLRERTTLNATCVTEEHAHHLKDMSEVPCADFCEPMPRRLTEFLGTIPPWLRAHLRVMRGTIIEEHLDARHPETLIWEKVRVLRDEKWSPALFLGDVVLRGWSEDDITAERLEDEADAERQRKEQAAKAQATALGATAVLCLLGLGLLAVPLLGVAAAIGLGKGVAAVARGAASVLG